MTPERAGGTTWYPAVSWSQRKALQYWLQVLSADPSAKNPSPNAMAGTLKRGRGRGLEFLIPLCLSQCNPRISVVCQRESRETAPGEVPSRMGSIDIPRPILRGAVLNGLAWVPMCPQKNRLLHL